MGGDGTGGIVVFSSNAASSTRLSGSGAYVWTTTVCSAPGGKVNTAVASDGAGGLVYAWLDARSGSYQLYAQKLDGAGSRQWTQGDGQGVLVCSPPAISQPPVVVGDGSGGAYLAWQDIRPGTIGFADIYAQHLNAAGTPLWAADGIPICDAAGAQEYPVIIGDDAGGVIVAWWDSRGGFRDVYAQRVNGSGAGLWGANGRVVISAGLDQLLPVMAPDGAHGAFVAWEDHRAGGVDGLDVYAQHLDGTGTGLWAALGVPVATDPKPDVRPSIVGDGAGGVVIAWSGGIANYGLYAQRLDFGGTARWPSNGVQVITTTSSTVPTLAPGLAPDGSGGAFVSPGRVLANGDAAWMPNYRAGITAITDEPGDEGGVVQVSMTRAIADGGGILGPAVAGYSLWRRVPGTSALASSSTARALGSPRPGQGLELQEVQAAQAGFPPGSWALVTYLPATQSPGYLLLAPTHTDSTAAGPADDAFVIVSYTTTVTAAVTSLPDSGHSVDNLAPAPPADLTGGRTGESSVQLAWSPNRERDLWHYAVYKGTSPSFVPSPANRIGQPTSPSWTDPSFEPGVTHYRVSAVDRHDNESSYSVLTPSEITSVAPGVVPAHTDLAPPAPNPFRAWSVIEYGLAHGSRVHLEIFDLQGRRVCTLVNASETAGVRRIVWDGRDAGGARVPLGRYVVRLRADGVDRTRTVVRTS